MLPHQNDQRRKYIPYTVSDIAWSKQPEWMRWIVTSPPDEAQAHLLLRTPAELSSLVQFCVKYHSEERLFWAFKELVTREPIEHGLIREAMEMHPALVFPLIKTYPPEDDGTLPNEIAPLASSILRSLLKAANLLGMPVLVALEKLSGTITLLPLAEYLPLLELASQCIRPPTVVQEVLLVLHEIRSADEALTPTLKYAHQHGLGISFDRAEEAADECPCDDDGKPRKRGKSKAPPRVRLHFIEEDRKHIRADVRIDLPSDVRLHSLVRLQSASNPEKGWRAPWMMDGLVVESGRGDLKIELLHPFPSEMEEMDWFMYNGSSVGKSFCHLSRKYQIHSPLWSATAKAMMDAVLKLCTLGQGCCSFARIITHGGSISENDGMPHDEDGDQQQAVDGVDHDSPEHVTVDSDDERNALSTFNESQRLAVQRCRAPLSLIWGPPGRLSVMMRLFSAYPRAGTGKTTVVIQILRHIMRERAATESKLLITASTHNGEPEGVLLLKTMFTISGSR